MINQDAPLRVLRLQYLQRLLNLLWYHERDPLIYWLRMGRSQLSRKFSPPIYVYVLHTYLFSRPFTSPLTIPQISITQAFIYFTNIHSTSIQNWVAVDIIVSGLFIFISLNIISLLSLFDITLTLNARFLFFSKHEFFHPHIMYLR